MLRLGLDLGTNSIGWALYRLDGDGEPAELIDGGVLIHQDGRNSQSRASNAAERREARGARRNRGRMLQRRQRVARLLRNLDLLPDNEDERAALRKLDPMRLRAAALDPPLARRELGRALLSFVDRRGFKSNRKTDGGEDGKIREDTDKLRQRIARSGARTLGEYLWRRRRQGKPIRARLNDDRGEGLYPDREMIEHELGEIRRAQAPHHPHIADEAWDKLIDELLFQRPLRPVERGECTLLRGELRAYRAYPLFQRFRIWQEVLNIKVSPPGEARRELTRRECERLADKLLATKERTFDQIVGDLDLPAGTRINLRTTARDKLQGDQTAAVLRSRSRFGKKWAGLSLDRQQEIVERLLDEEDADALEDWLQEECDLDENAAQAVASARLPQGTGSLSKEAIVRLLPHMQAGLLYDKAVQAAGLGHHSDRRGDGKLDRLPDDYGALLWRHVVGGRVANPTVHIALGQVRRLFNAIVDEYGKKPDEVVVELARELKQNERQRREYERRQNENRKRNERLRAEAADAGRPNPSGEDMRKLRLWDEQGPPGERVCPYTGEPLTIGRVLSGETEIDHILPRSRSLDNSMNNTVVAMRSANRAKGDRTPHEAWGGDAARYDAILDRARRLPPGKRRRFEPDAMERWNDGPDGGDFLDRQLHETAYLSRLIREYLEAVVHPDRIWATPGGMTARLRRAWDLDDILAHDDPRKNRDDHRHHLTDAAVIGLTSRSMLQRVARAYASGDAPGRNAPLQLEPPWEGFKQDLAALAERVVVRHRPNHFKPAPGATTGSLHNATPYGIVERHDKGMATLVVTKPLRDLNPKSLDTIRDPGLRRKLRELWESVDAEESKPGEKWARFVELARRRHSGVRRVQVLSRANLGSLFIRYNANGDEWQAYKTDGNAFMDIWLLPNGKTVGETVTRFDAHQPDFRSKVKKDHPTTKKLMRLHRDDMIAVGEGEERRIMRVLKLSKQQIDAVDHTAGGKAHDLSPYRKSAGQVIQVGLRKVSVDVLGRVRDGGAWTADRRSRG